MKVSSLSPDLWDIMVLNPINWANLITSRVSETVPIWLSFTKEIIDKIPINNNLPPEGLSIIKIDKSTGKRANKETKNSIFEYYLEEHTPN